MSSTDQNGVIGEGEGAPVATAVPSTMAPDDVKAYKHNLASHKDGMTPEQMAESYTTWAKAGTYEKDLCPGRYNGPQIAADYVRKYCNISGASPDLVAILDVAAGTGFVGQRLKQHGFKIVDALEPASGMVEEAKKKGCYRHYYVDFLGGSIVNIANDTYDFLVISGGMGEGHIPCSCLHEMIRLVKPGGYVVIVMRQEYLSYVKEYVDRLEPLMATLAGENKWSREARDIVPNYSFNKNGIVFVYKVL